MNEPEDKLEDDELNWISILEANPKSKEGVFNSEREKLLQVGVHILLSPPTAETWIRALRIRREAAEEAARAQGQPIPEAKKEGVRVTIVRIPDETRTNNETRANRIVVEADGIQAEIDASVFYNSIKGEDISPISFSTSEPLVGRSDFGVG